MRFTFGQGVRVTEGFYKGQSGTIIDELYYTLFGNGEFEYKISLEYPIGEIKTIQIPEKSLEKLK